MLLDNYDLNFTVSAGKQKSQIIMGRITIFTIESCHHCLRVKAALHSHDIPFVEISLSNEPVRRADMVSLSNRVTVPQVFFNETFIGGADETIELLNQWNIECKSTIEHALKYSSLRHRCEDECFSLPEPKDPRLKLPLVKPSIIKSTQQPSKIRLQSVEMPDGQRMSVHEATKLVMQILPQKSLSLARTATIYKRCFRGSECITALMKHYPSCTREQIVQFGCYLQDLHIIHSIPDRAAKFSDTPHLYLRLQPFQSPDVLNSFLRWDESETTETDPLELISRLIKQLETLLSCSTSSETGEVDYVAASQCDDYYSFEEATCEIQAVNLGSMDLPTKVAFCISLYNLIVRHAYLKVGIPSSSLARHAFFSHVKYNVGKNLYSLNELEHGILRGNVKPPYSFSTPFSSKSDPRMAYAISTTEVDPRIHFALNCGARSCPPVKIYSSSMLNEELQTAAQAFCEDDETGVRLVASDRAVYLSSIFKWYCSDFGCRSPSQLPPKLIPYLRGSKQDLLQSMLYDEPHQRKIPIVVKFLPYDWSSNASKNKEFDSTSLGCDEVSVRALFHSISDTFKSN